MKTQVVSVPIYTKFPVLGFSVVAVFKVTCPLARLRFVASLVVEQSFIIRQPYPCLDTHISSRANRTLKDEVCTVLTGASERKVITISGPALFDAAPPLRPLRARWFSSPWTNATFLPDQRCGYPAPASIRTASNTKQERGYRHPRERRRRPVKQ